MKHYYSKLSLLALALTLSGSLGMMAKPASRAYGIQVYSESMTLDDTQKLVSFPLDNLQDITVEEDFGDAIILAGAAYDGIYYLLYTDDGVVPSKFVTYDIKRHRFNDVKVYNYTYDVAGSLMVLDMTYDPASARLYAVAADLGDGEIIGDELNAPFGLYKIDPLTGDAELTEYQEITTIVSLAAGNPGLWGIDEKGEVWTINKDTGHLEDIIYTSDILPIGVQSMSYDFGNGTFYWASYTASAEFTGMSELVSFSLHDGYEIIYDELGPIGNDIELIGFYIDDNPLDPKAPRGVEGLTVTPADNGKNEATLLWTNPEKSIDGSSLSGPITISIMRNDEKAGEVTGNPGETMTWTDTLTNSALCSYIVTPYADGLEGTSVYAEEIFVGTDVPGAPTDVKSVRAADSYAITVSWGVPEDGANGGWFDSSDLHYSVTRYPDNKVIVENTADLQVMDTDITVQAGYTYGIKATSGKGFGPEGISNVTVSGPALEPPYVMTLTEEDENLWTIVNSDGDEYTWYVYHGMWGGTTDPFFRYYPEETIDPFDAAEDWIISPFIALEAGKKYIVTYDLRLYGEWFLADTSLWIGNDNTPEAMTRQIAYYEQEMINVEWVTHTLPVTVETDGSYNFGFRMHNRVPAQLYKFTVREVPEVDLETLSLNGPQTLTLKQPFTYQTEIKNIGFNSVDNYTVSLKDSEGTTLAQTTVDTPITPGEIATVEIEWTPEMAGEITIHAEAAAESDAISTNNASPEMSVNVVNDGSWIDVVTANYSTGREPFFTQHNYSASQTIYPAEIIKLEKGVELRALSYYIADFLTKNPFDCNIEIWLANTSEKEFTDHMIPEEEFTKVFDGKVTMSPEDKQVTLIFDTPFIYTGNNLAIFTRHESEGHASIVFGSYYDKTSPYYTLEYFSDEEEFNFTQEMLLSKEIPALSLLVYGNSGIFTPTSDSATVTYNHMSRTLNISGEYDNCKVYSANGVLLAMFRPGNDMTLPASANGIAIVEVTTPNGKVIKKIAL